MDQEEGSIESALTLIPLTAFFLLVMQLLIAGSWQQVELVRLHDLVARIKIDNQEDRQLAENLQAEGLSVESKRLRDGSSLIAISRMTRIPVVTSLLGKEASITATTLAID